MGSRKRRAGAAALAIAVHALVVLLIFFVRSPQAPEERVNTVQMTLSDQPEPQNIEIGPVPVTVDLSTVVHLKEFAPPTIGLPVEVPASPTPSPITLAAAAPQPGSASSGLNGKDHDSSGPSGGGRGLVLLKRVVPAYPAMSKMRGEQGVIGVHYVVSQDGHVRQAKVSRTSGFRGLDEAAVDAVRKWRFSPTIEDSAPQGMEFDTELRFVLYKFQYSLIGRSAADAVFQEQIKYGASDEATPGSLEALTRFIAEVANENYLGGPDRENQAEIVKMREALKEWGAVKAIHFTGVTGPARWLRYRVPPGTVADQRTETVVSWNNFEVFHQNAKSAWLVAVDREGAIWSARASPAPW